MSAELKARPKGLISCNRRETIPQASTAERPSVLPPAVGRAAVAIYFFHLRDGVDLLLDEEGSEMADMAAVGAHTLVAARWRPAPILGRN
jgi:hypothetical protein